MRKQLTIGYLLYFFIVLFCVSCSPRIRWPQQNISISIANNIDKIFVQNSTELDLRSKTRKGKIPGVSRHRIRRKSDHVTFKIAIPKSNQPIPIIVYKDSIQKTVLLSPYKPFLSLFNMHCICGVKDSLNVYTAKCWSFPRKNYIYFEDTCAFLERAMPAKKGDLFITYSAGAPVFSIKSDYGYYNTAGVLAAEIGFQYFYERNKFISFAAGAATNVLPLPIEHLGAYYYYERAGALYASVRNNLVINNKFDIGYGLQLSKFFWTRVSFNDSLHPANSMYTVGLGPGVSVNYKVMPFMRVGVLYQPNLINLNISPKLGYQHYLSFRLTIDIRHRK